ncbi:MAG: precorrin-3B C(17)-methyltransferase [Myxococcales bacterium]|nr:precorrin-3B C(17)-methyltransferase [Myxococcales bacterium]
MTGWLKVVGLGPGNAKQCTHEVTSILETITDLVGYSSYLSRVPTRPGVTVHTSSNGVEVARAKLSLELAQAGRKVGLVSSGDPGVFAMASAVFEALEQTPALQTVDVQILPGITAMLAAAARAGAPLGHDFCALNASDNLKPWSVVERRIRCAVEADFVLALYNPRSKARPHGFNRIVSQLRAQCEPTRWVLLAEAVSTINESIQWFPLSELQADKVNMRTLVIVGNRYTRPVGRWLYTPRYYQ